MMEFLVGMEQMMWSGIGTLDAARKSSSALSSVAFLRCLMDWLSNYSKIVYNVHFLVCDKVVTFRMAVDTTASQELMDGTV